MRLTKPPTNILDTDGRNLNNSEVGNPVRCRRQCRTLGSHRERVNLGGIQPRNGKHADAEACMVLGNSKSVSNLTSVLVGY